MLSEKLCAAVGVHTVFEALLRAHLWKKKPKKEEVVHLNDVWRLSKNDTGHAR